MVSKCQKAIKATKATKLGFCSCGQGMCFSQYVPKLLAVKASKCLEVKKVIKAIKAILAFMRLQSGVPILLFLHQARLFLTETAQQSKWLLFFAWINYSVLFKPCLEMRTEAC